MPKGWFGPKRVGYGARPKSWEGWLATALFGVVVIATSRFVAPPLAHYLGMGPVPIIGLLGVIELGLFLLLVRVTFDQNA
jgi:hypothetical protein